MSEDPSHDGGTGTRTSASSGATPQMETVVWLKRKIVSRVAAANEKLAPQRQELSSPRHETWFTLPSKENPRHPSGRDRSKEGRIERRVDLTTPWSCSDVCHLAVRDAGHVPPERPELLDRTQPVSPVVQIDTPTDYALDTAWMRFSGHQLSDLQIHRDGAAELVGVQFIRQKPPGILGIWR